MQDFETRTCKSTRLHVAKRTKKFDGWAAVFNRLSDPIGGALCFRERILPGAFAEAIATGADVRALVDHDPSKILGRTAAGTLRLAEDERGLHTTIDPPDTQAGRDIAISIKRGDVSQMSFSFTVPPDGDEWDTVDGEEIRTLKRVNLFDVSIVSFPAYPDTTVAIRTLQQRKSRDGLRRLRVALAKRELILLEV